MRVPSFCCRLWNCFLRHVSFQAWAYLGAWIHGLSGAYFSVFEVFEAVCIILGKRFGCLWSCCCWDWGMWEMPSLAGITIEKVLCAKRASTRYAHSILRLAFSFCWWILRWLHSSSWRYCKSIGAFQWSPSLFSILESFKRHKKSCHPKEN